MSAAVKQHKLLLPSVVATNLGICGMKKGMDVHLLLLCETIIFFYGDTKARNSNSTCFSLKEAYNNQSSSELKLLEK